jgi:hypothetical protein
MREAMIAFAFLAVARVAAVPFAAAARVVAIALQALAVLPASARWIILAPFRIGFADLAVVRQC